ncbi:DUF3054 domain-containing protein [Halobacteriales archaeon QS_4_69_34]|nr:MAG: DUF3054 domain-containing protein [Halobacteriales archaeon QS_4_69_34]
MNSTVASLRARVEPSPTSAGLAFGDGALIAAFVLLGELRHGYGLLADPLRVLDTALPFFLGWALAAVLAGVYAPRARRSTRVAARATTFAWIGAALLGQALRASPLFHGGFALPFVLVSFGVGLLLLVPWRVAVAYGLSGRA